jgi:hypothetical protein
MSIIVQFSLHGNCNQPPYRFSTKIPISEFFPGFWSEYSDFGIFIFGADLFFVYSGVMIESRNDLIKAAL